MSELLNLKNRCDDIATKINRMANIKNQQNTLKQEYDTLEAELLKYAQDDLANTKYKSISYEGDSCKAQATVSETVKITLESLLPLIFGKAYKDMVKETTKLELTAPAKRLIAGIWQGNFVDTTTSDVIATMSLDDKSAKLVAKKCKGTNYKKDIENLIAITGCTEQQAQEYAYMLMEAAVWQQFKTICKINDINTEEQEQIDELMKRIQAAFVVELTTKVSVEG